MISVEGIWKVELGGPYGWDVLSTAFLEGGKYRAASKEHFTIGTYEVDGDDIRIRAKVVQHGGNRSLFGTRGAAQLSFEGKTDGDRIEGFATDHAGKFKTAFLATKLSTIPELDGGEGG